MSDAITVERAEFAIAESVAPADALAPEPAPPTPGDPVAVRKTVVLLLLAGLAAYSTSFAGVFLLDDVACIPGNPTLGNFLIPGPIWQRPVAAASLSLNFWIDGHHPRGYHAVNLGVH